MEPPTNPYCKTLGIEVPDLARVRTHKAVSSYSLLIAALLERGAPMRLEEVARRFEAAGVAPADVALQSLKRCRPATSPVYRDGDLYALDPHDRGTLLWAVRLGLRPPQPARAAPPSRPEPGPLPSADEPVTVALLEEAWAEGIPDAWSTQRVAVCVLDAHRRPMEPIDAGAFTARFRKRNPLSAATARDWHRASAVRVRDDGKWELVPGHPSIRSAREAVLERVAMVRRWASVRGDPEEVAANIRRWEEERTERARRLAALSRVIVHAFPAPAPEALVLLDVGKRQLATSLRDEVARAASRIMEYEVVAGLDVRGTLRALGVDPGRRMLHELGPPQKTIRLNSRGRTLKITTEMLVRGSCRIGRPFGTASDLRLYLEGGHDTKLRRRLESDAKSLLALYQYGLLHGAVRLRWGFLDERLPVPWCDWDEVALPLLLKQAHERRLPLEVVVGSAPGWSDPWSRARRAWVRSRSLAFGTRVVEDDGFEIDPSEIQLARIAESEGRFRIAHGAADPPVP